MIATNAAAQLPVLLATLQLTSANSTTTLFAVSPFSDIMTLGLQQLCRAAIRTAVVILQ